MSDALQNTCMIYKPTLMERMWRKLGYRYHLGDEPDDGREALPGWQSVETRFCFSFADRLRLFATGKLHVRHVSHTDTPSPKDMRSRVDWHILAPGAKH